MKRILIAAVLCLFGCAAALAQEGFRTPNGGNVNPIVVDCLNGSNQVLPCATSQNGNGPVLLVNLGNSLPASSTPVTASATGSTGAISATLPANAGASTYICGFSFQGSDATAAVAGNIAVTGTISGTMNFGYVALAAGATVPQPGPITVSFTPCVKSSGTNTAIVVTPPTLGTGATLATVSAWGYQAP